MSSDVPDAFDRLVAQIHKWPGGAPNEVWTAVSDMKVALEQTVARLRQASVHLDRMIEAGERLDKDRTRQ